MLLSPLDVTIVSVSVLLTLTLGAVAARRAGRSTAEYFLSGRSLPWWMLGTSMVATTFSADTPNLVTELVRRHGVSGNWIWWAFLLTAMVTAFVYARLWRRAGMTTDLEFYELRYSGPAAAFLRGFRALYLGYFYNVMIMALVMLAAIKIGVVMLGLRGSTIVLLVGAVTLLYSATGGLRAVIWTDMLQFGLAMAGSIAAAVVIVRLPAIGGLHALIADPAVAPRLSFLPDFSDTETLLVVFVVPLAVQWWSAWYPGAEPGGGGYTAQRMLAARNEREAQGAMLLFNVAHYALRPWPWILIALASLVVFPDLASLQARFPDVDPAIVKHDLAYPAMLTYLPAGLLGLVVASLLAAVMSTLSTHLNWGASYLVNDVYRRFLRPDAGERRAVWVGRLASVVLMASAGAAALLLQNALQAFHLLLQVGAGTGLIFLVRWFWWRVNAWCEIVAMVSSFTIAAWFQLVHPRLFGELPEFVPYVVNVAVTTLLWTATAWLTAPAEETTLREYCRTVRPWGRGWERFRDGSASDREPGPAQAIAAVFCGVVLVYASLFGIGFVLYDRPGATGICALCVAAALVAVIRLRPWRKGETA